MTPKLTDADRINYTWFEHLLIDGAWNRGRAVVIVCPLEPAELYRDRLESCKLTATIEPTA